MYKLIPFDESLDLTKFYQEAAKRGFDNNSSQKAMVDCFQNEKEWKVWILYQGTTPVGSVATHTFDSVMGKNAWRICARTCAFSISRPKKGLLTSNQMFNRHQHITDQLFIPATIDWIGLGQRYFATSNESEKASQRLVNKLYFPTLEKMNIVQQVARIKYRGHLQTIWEYDIDAFMKSLNQHPRWV